MSFIQIIEHTTSKPDEVRALSEEMRAQRGDDTPVRRMTACADRDKPGHYFVIVEFDSYEAAMANSNDPRTQEFSARLGELLDGPPSFHNLDVIVQETF